MSNTVYLVGVARDFLPKSGGITESVCAYVRPDLISGFRTARRLWRAFQDFDLELNQLVTSKAKYGTPIAHVAIVKQQASGWRRLVGNLRVHLRALWNMARGTSCPLPAFDNPAREEFEKAYDTMLAETAVSLEAAERPKDRRLRLIA
jgi:hypothetical protein